MNKSDLQDGYGIGLRKYNRCGDAEYYKGYIIDFQTEQMISLGVDYNDDLTHKYDEDLDIMAVYDDKESKCLWNREEIDWSKVPLGTKVICYDFENEKFEGIYLGYESKIFTYPFRVYVSNINETRWSHCELIKDICDETLLKECIKNFDKFCTRTKLCDECEYGKYLSIEDACSIRFVFENYNVTRK